MRNMIKRTSPLWKKIRVKKRWKCVIMPLLFFSLLWICLKIVSVLCVLRQNIEGTTIKMFATSTIITTTPTPVFNYSYPYDINFEEYFDKLERKEVERLPPINPHNFKYLLNPKKICAMQDEESCEFFILVLIKSARENFHLRQTIRWNWMQFGKRKDCARIVFLLGNSRNESNVEIKAEYSVFKDIVQENFHDAYVNLTYKSIMGYNWATKYCSVASHILYQDDDFHFNIDTLITYLKSHPNPDLVYMGYYVADPEPMRSNTSLYYVTKEDYPNERYPPYLPGGAYVVSMHIARKFAKVFPYVKHLFIDDVYLGIVANKLNITCYQSDLISFNNCTALPSVISCRGYVTFREIFTGWKNFVKNLRKMRLLSLFSKGNH